MTEDKLTQSWTTWSIAGRDGEVVVHEEVDRSAVVLEIRPSQGAAAKLLLSPQAWLALAELRYRVNIDMPARGPGEGL